MGYILIQPGDSLETLAAVKYIQYTGEYIFDRTSSGSCLMHVFFNCHSTFYHEKYYHSFVGEIVCCRSTISRLRKYLWGSLFY